jgi:hypothetical protein
MFAALACTSTVLFIDLNCTLLFIALKYKKKKAMNSTAKVQRNKAMNSNVVLHQLKAMKSSVSLQQFKAMNSTIEVQSKAMNSRVQFYLRDFL